MEPHVHAAVGIHPDLGAQRGVEDFEVAIHPGGEIPKGVDERSQPLVRIVVLAALLRGATSRDNVSHRVARRETECSGELLKPHPPRRPERGKSDRT